MIATSDYIKWIRQHVNDQLKTGGYDEFEYDTDDKFTLTEFRISVATISVFQNGTVINTAFWSYDSSTNRVTLDTLASGFTVTAGDNFRIEYSYYEKYSDNEIKGYLEGSLLYFAEFRHGKTYFMDSNESIVSSNNTNPSRKEAYLISIVTAIHIDPDNVDLRTSDFQITRRQDKSKKDQITDTIARFQRFVGVVDYDDPDSDLT